jgi:hypothetical protein
MNYKRFSEGRMSKHRRAIAAAACALALSGVCGTVPAGAAPTEQARPSPAGDGAHAAVATAQPALWRTYDMLVNFQNLPRTYTCDQLWYEFHGILLRLGAPLVGINILPYNCSPSPSGDMKSPNVEARFQLPFLLQPGLKGAPFEAVERTIRLSPGEPKTLHASDCQLFQQIDQTLLASLPVKVHNAHFDCSAPPPRSGEFAVTLTLPVDTTVAATIAGAGR